jgi:cytochrome d ubiquinol oxidase subunit II
MTAALLLGGAMLGALVLYALTAGADFGGGVWDLLASGRSRRAQRALIERAIGPIWEANHVWLILVLVLLFAAFPPAFARIATVLHAPILLLLLCVVARGVAFTFRHYDVRRGAVERRWGALFSAGSAGAPFLMGTIVGALTSGRTREFAGATLGEPTALWLGLWPVAVGVFTLALFAYLAAVYLCVEARDEGGATVPAFQTRALVAWLASALLAVLLLFAARRWAPEVAHGLTSHLWSLPCLAATLAASLLALHGLVRRRFRLARAAAATQVALIVLGWGGSQYPWLVVGEHTLAGAAAHPSVLRALLIALAVGSALLFPSLYYLYRAFKGQRTRAS